MASDRIWGNRNSKIVVIDSSALMMLFEFSINLEKELSRLLGSYQIVVPRSVLKELEYLSENSKGKKKQIAKPALQLAKKYEIVNDESIDADSAVLDLAKKYNGIVLSNDKELRKKAKEQKLRTICLRGKNYLMLDEPIL